MSLKRCPFRVSEKGDGANEFGKCYEDACPYYDHDNSYFCSKKSYCKKVQMELTAQTKILSENVLNSIAEGFK